MSLFTDASLVVKPSLYKAGKLYAIKPGTGLADLTVVRNSVKWGVGPNGVLRQVAANVPLIEYNPVTRAELGLLVETGATNIVQRSQEFDNAYWSKVESTVTANAGVAPDGATTMDKLIPSTNNTQHRVERGTTSTNAVHTFSIYAKADGYTRCSLRADGGLAANFNLTTGAISSIAGGTTALAEQYPDGVWRLSISGTFSTNASVRVNVETGTGVAGSFAGDGTSGILLWQAQVETGPVATSPIVTTASTASRVADSVSRTSASSFIGQTEGVVYAEVVSRTLNLGSVGRIVSLTDGTTNNRIGLTRQANNNNRFQGIVSVGGSLTAQILQPSDVAENAATKMAIAYATDDIAFYVNGSSIGTDTSSAVPACNQIEIGSQLGSEQFLNGWIRSVALFPARLSNAELQFITT